MKNENKKRSPLRSCPLRQPGQSLDEKMRYIVVDKMLMPIFSISLIFLIALSEWIRYFFNTPPEPFLFTFIAIIISIYSGNKIYGFWKEFKNIKLGRDGERVVGQSLEELRKKGYEVFHDIINEGFNIDHIIVGPGGVFTIETKTISKKGNSEIFYDGVEIKIDGFTPDRNPITQVKGQVYWLENFLAEHAKIKVKVKPVVIYPGWFINNQKSNNTEVWVLNEKALPSYLENRDIALNQEQINLIASHIESYIKNYKEDK